MAARLPVWGIDIGQCSLKALKLAPGGDRKVELLAFDVVEHDAVLSQNEGEAPAMIRKSVDTFRQRHDLRNCEIVIAVPGQQTLTRFTKMPPVDRKKIPDMVQYEAGQQIPFDMDEVVWDYHVFSEPDSPDVEVGIFAIRKEIIRGFLAQFSDLGVEPTIVQAAPMASYNAVRFERPPPADQAIILLDMGALATDLIVMEGSTIWSRPVPVGGNRFTDALVAAFKVPFKRAEDLKRNAAASKYARQIFQAMRPVFADLVSEVQRSIGYYTSTHRDAHLTRIVGMGNAFRLPGLQKFLQQNLQIEVDKLERFGRLDAPLAQGKPEFEDNVMSFAVAYGLALQGLGLAAVDSNLLPPEVHKSMLWRKKQGWFIGAAASLALAAASIWFGNARADSQLDDVMNGVTDAQPASVASVEEAESILASAPADEKLKYAKRVIGAVNKLRNELSAVSKPDETLAKLQEFAKIPAQNVVVPQIIDVIHRACAAATHPDIAACRSALDYLDAAKRVPRGERDEVWVDELTLFFRPDDPLNYFASPDSTETRGNKPGWAVILKARTTRSNPQDNRWIDDKLIEVLYRMGTEPRKGFYFKNVRLQQFYRAGAVAPTGFAPPGGPEIQTPFAPGRPGRDDRTHPGGEPGGFNPLLPARSPGGHTGPAAEDIRKFDVKPGVDPLTEEATTTDSVLFEIRFLVYLGDVPEKEMHPAWRPKQPEAGKPGETPTEEPAAPKPPPQPQRRD